MPVVMLANRGNCGKGSSRHFKRFFMREISSKDNKIVKTAASLSEKKNRDALGLYLIEGPNLVREALQQGISLKFVFTWAGARSEETEEILRLAEKCDSAVYVLSDDCFSRIKQTENPQGIIAVGEEKYCTEEQFFADKDSNILVLDRIQDPGNLGTMLRTAEGCGFKGALLVKGCADPFGPKAVRSSAGCVFRFPLLPCDSPAHGLEILARQRKNVYTADMDGTACYDAALAHNCALVIGNEGNGADQKFKDNSERVSIPQEGNTESLNAALAAGIIMYESLRQRRA